VIKKLLLGPPVTAGWSPVQEIFRQRISWKDAF